MKDSLKQRLAMTSGAAAAAFGPVAVQGAVVYNDTSPITATFNTPDNGDDWDVDGDAMTDFRLEQFRFFRTGYSGSAGYAASAFAWVALASNGEGGRGLVKQGGGASALGQLAAGFAVGPTLATGYSFGASGQQYRSFVRDTTNSFAGTPGGLSSANALYGRLSAGINAVFQNGAFGNNFIGFRFDISGAMHYGWAELFIEAGSAGAATDVTITRWAYESTADCGLQVGQTSGDNCPPDPATIPNPGTLALLAAGAAGLRRWRGKADAA